MTLSPLAAELGQPMTVAAVIVHTFLRRDANALSTTASHVIVLNQFRGLVPPLGAGALGESASHETIQCARR
jgi:hypothetical protein